MLIEAIQDETEILKDHHKDQRQTSGTMMLDNQTYRNNATLIIFLISYPKEIFLLEFIDASYLLNTIELICELLELFPWLWGSKMPCKL